ncbi:hypothetical protein OHA25_19385 [Nonomuraea sp. NBC_00507]|uniref:hypothetical protein n=1 Tax=Nonomuraea sp. NBC_00507 TaxID=2976002 RepID=UPI002E1709CD
MYLAITDTASNLVWISVEGPGRSSEITAARHHKLTARLREAGLGVIAYLGFAGLEDNPDDPVVITGRKAARNGPDPGRQAGQPANQQRTRAGRARLRRPEDWRILTKVRMHGADATKILRALMVLVTTQTTR